MFRDIVEHKKGKITDMPDIPYKVPGTGETRYKHITSGQQRLMAKMNWDRAVARARAERNSVAYTIVIQNELQETHVSETFASRDAVDQWVEDQETLLDQFMNSQMQNIPPGLLLNEGCGVVVTETETGKRFLLTDEWEEIDR